jgi:hypothetical protein
VGQAYSSINSTSQTKAAKTANETDVLIALTTGEPALVQSEGALLLTGAAAQRYKQRMEKWRRPGAVADAILGTNLAKQRNGRCRAMERSGTLLCIVA